MFFFFLMILTKRSVSVFTILLPFEKKKIGDKFLLLTHPSYDVNEVFSEEIRNLGYSIF